MDNASKKHNRHNILCFDNIAPIMSNGDKYADTNQMTCARCVVAGNTYSGGVYDIGGGYKLGCISCMRRLIRYTPRGGPRAAMIEHCKRTAPATYNEMMEQIAHETH